MDALGIPEAVRSDLDKAFSKWLKLQAGDVIRLAGRLLGQRAAQDAEALMDALNQYFRDAAGNVPKEIRDGLRKVCMAACDKIMEELPDGEDLREEWLDEHMEEYFPEMGARLCEANRREVQRIVEREDGQDTLNVLTTTLTGWQMVRAKQMSRNECLFSYNETLVDGYHQKNVQCYWKANDAECPACQSLTGQTITTLKPPLHKGCVCTVVMGERVRSADERAQDANGKFTTSLTVSGFQGMRKE